MLTPPGRCGGESVMRSIIITWGRIRLCPAVGRLYPYSPSFAPLSLGSNLLSQRPPPRSTHTRVPPSLHPRRQTFTHVSSRYRPDQSCLSASLVLLLHLCSTPTTRKRKNNICLPIIRCCIRHFVGSALSVRSSLKGTQKAARFHSRRLLN